MANGRILISKPSGGVTTVTSVDGVGNTTLVLPESGTVATTADLNYLGNVTSDIQTQLNAKAPLASPNFNGIPTAPTAPTTTNTTQIATTAFVKNEINNSSFAPSYGGIGSYVLAGCTTYPTTTTVSDIAPNTTVAGSTLIRDSYQATTSQGSGLNTYDALNPHISGTSNVTLSLTGTWRLMTYIKRRSNSTSFYPLALWLRIS